MDVFERLGFSGVPHAEFELADFDDCGECPFSVGDVLDGWGEPFEA